MRLSLINKPLSIAACMALAGHLASAHAATTTGHTIRLDAKLNNTTKPITLHLPKGRYTVIPVRAPTGDYTAWSVWEKTTCSQPKGCLRMARTRFTGMHNNYYVMSDRLSEASVNGKPLPVVATTPPNREFSYFLANGNGKAYEVTENRIYPNEATALAAARASTFVLEVDAPVAFALLDKSRITDNRGGMTLEVRRVGD